MCKCDCPVVCECGLHEMCEYSWPVACECGWHVV